MIHPHKARTRRHSLFRSRVKNVDFSFAYSSDSGRAIETARIILGEHSKGKEIPYFIEKGLENGVSGLLKVDMTWKCGV